MELNIGGKARELRFGIGFVRKLDEVYTVEMNGIPFGIGLTMASLQMKQYNPAALSEVVRCASKGNPSLREVDNTIEEYADEHDGLKGLFELVIAEVGKSSIVKDTMTKLEQAEK